MQQYWIIRDGSPDGPFDESRIKEMGLDPSTPVWREGLTDWITLVELPEYATLTAAEPTGECPPPLPVAGSDEPSEQRMFPEGPDNSFRPAQEPRPAGNASPGRPSTDEFAPSYLGWSIAVTLLCCIPLGIVAIFMSIKVNTLNLRGEFEAARRISANTELWIIAAFTLGIVSAPFTALIQMASAL